MIALEAFWDTVDGINPASSNVYYTTTIPMVLVDFGI